MTRQEAELILQRKFNLSKFYDEQWLAIDKILRGEKVLLIEKTGAVETSQPTLFS